MAAEPSTSPDNVKMAANLQADLQKQNFGAGSSATSGEHELTFPIIHQRGEEFQGDSQGTHQPIGDIENTDHINTIPEPDDHICRTCGPDEDVTEDTDDILVELGCDCRGTLSRMHRKCILKWFGPRICLQRNYRCELCNAFLHGRIEFVLIHAMFDRDSSIRDILIKALIASRPRRFPRRLQPRYAPAHENDDPNVQIDVRIARQAERAQGRQRQLLHTLNDAPIQMPRCQNISVKLGVILGLLGFYTYIIHHYT